MIAARESAMEARTPPQVVIAGAGFGRLEASRALAKVEVDVMLIDAYNHHCFQPLLYEVATAALSPADIAWPIRAILREQKNVRLIMARVTAIDTVGRSVRTNEIDLPYDYLVLATGATHSYFGHDDWAPFAPGLKHIADATEIRRRFLLAFERAKWWRTRPSERACSLLSLSAAAPLAWKWPAPLRKWRGKLCSTTSAASIRGPRLWF
jgi:NADH dehydrogenase